MLAKPKPKKSQKKSMNRKGKPPKKKKVKKRKNKHLATKQTYNDLHVTFDGWLSLGKDDHDAIDVGLAAAIDRDTPGDPFWVWLIGPSGCGKTEIIRALSGWHKIYTLDTLTPRTFISGKIFVDKKTGKTSIGGLLPYLDGRVLTIKDFTGLLSIPEKDRYEIFGQLRMIHDGYYEKAFGNIKKKVKVKADMGLIAGVTPVIDMHYKVASALGQRFVNVRLRPNRISATKRAQRNVGKGKRMRKELKEAVSNHLWSVTHPLVMPTITKQQKKQLRNMSHYVTPMRTWVHTKVNFRGEVVSINPETPEYATRQVQQLTKLAINLAIIRGHKAVDANDMNTLARVARDCPTVKRQKVLEAVYELTKTTAFTTTYHIYKTARMHRNTVVIEVEKMVALDILERDDIADSFRIHPDFEPLVDSVMLKEEEIKQVRHDRKEAREKSALTNDGLPGLTSYGKKDDAKETNAVNTFVKLWPGMEIEKKQLYLKFAKWWKKKFGKAKVPSKNMFGHLLKRHPDVGEKRMRVKGTKKTIEVWFKIEK
jgi:energy-coupling factor transporter ATP-binding protein EcfA2